MRYKILYFCIVIMGSYAMEIPLFKQQSVVRLSNNSIKNISFAPIKTNDPLLAVQYVGDGETNSSGLSFLHLLPSTQPTLCRIKDLSRTIIDHAWSSLNPYVALLYQDGVEIWGCQTWDFQTVERKWYKSFNEKAHSLCFHPTESQLVIAFDKKICFFQIPLLPDDELVCVYSLDLPTVLGEDKILQFNSNGDFLLYGTYLIAIKNNEIIPLTEENDLNKQCVHWHPYDEMVAIKKSTDMSDEVCLLKQDSTQTIAMGGKICALQWCPHGQFLMVGMQNGELRLIDSTNGNEVVTLRRILPSQYIRWSADRKYIAVSYTKKICILGVKEFFDDGSTIFLLPVFKAAPYHRYLMALLYAITPFLEGLRQLPYSFIEQAYKNNPRSIIIPALLALGTFRKNLQKKHKIAALNYLHNIAKEKLNQNQPTSEDSIMLFLEQLANAYYADLYKQFNISIQTLTQCLVCGAILKQGQRNNAYILLEPSENVSVEYLLDLYFASTSCLGKCLYCGDTDSECETIIREAPNIIVIILKRYYQTNGHDWYNNAVCSLKLEHLNISQYGNYLTDGDNYYLRSFIASSHNITKRNRYKAYVRKGDIWLCYSNNMLKKVKQEKINSFTTYLPDAKQYMPNILVYQREMGRD